MEMTVPQHVQEQFDAAQVLQQQVYAPASDKPTEAVEQTGTPAEQPVVAEAPVQPVEPVQAPEPPKVEPTKEDDRYKTLKHKYDAEVPRLHQAVKERDAELQALKARLESLEKQAEKPLEEPKQITDKDVEYFGQDLVDMVRRAAADVVRVESAKLLASVDERLKAIIGALGQVEEKVVISEADKFWGRVRTLVPDWDDVDADKGWIDFLSQSPDYTTETYRELAAKAIQSGKADKVANLVKTWRGFTVKEQPQPATPKQPHPDLQRQVAPPTAKASTPPAGQKTYTMAEYQALFDPRNPLGLSAKDLEAAQSDANRALAEGRVRW